MIDTSVGRCKQPPINPHQTEGRASCQQDGEEAATMADAVPSSAKRLFKTDLSGMELWVVSTTMLLVVKFAVDSFGPWYSNKFMAGTVKVLEGLNRTMVQYTMGLMQSTPTKNDFFQVWAVLMVTLQYSISVGRPYGSSKQMTLVDMLSSLWAANLLRERTFSLLDVPLWLIWSLNAARMIAYFLSADMASRINKGSLRLASDYMMYEHNNSGSADVDPVTMSGYKYLVSGEEKQADRLMIPNAKFASKSHSADLLYTSPDLEARISAIPSGQKFDLKDIITTEDVWALRHGDPLLSDNADPDNQFKDVCLSFAMFKLLRRRFYNLPLHELGHDKTRRLIIDGVLRVGTDNDYSRAFRITEVELSFMQDFFYGNHAAIFVNGFPFRRLALSLVLVSAISFVGYPVQHIPSRTSKAELQATTHGIFVTHSIMVLIVGKELWEIFVYVFSQWTKVWMLCTYIRKRRSTSQQCPKMEKAVRIMFRLITRGQWNQQIRQFNLLISYSPVKLIVDRLRPTTVQLQTEVKKAILEAFKDLQNPQSLQSYFSNAFKANGDWAQFLWADDLEADTHRILVWHIATCLCEIELCGEAAAAALKPFWLRPRLFAKDSRARNEDNQAISEDNEAILEDYVVAVTLSNYCAYLLIQEPPMVPDNKVVCVNVFEVVRRDVCSLTSGCKSLSDIRWYLMALAKNGNRYGYGSGCKTIPEMGATLVEQMFESYGQNRAAVWKVLARFWTGFVLHLAASTKAIRHKRHLEGRGELVTHLWALLSHAGFLGSENCEERLFGEDDASDVSID
ncbi:hypothetical protein ACP70R_008169 [Stipagrostis hirtigluma subsp. patula]